MIFLILKTLIIGMKACLYLKPVKAYFAYCNPKKDIDLALDQKQYLNSNIKNQNKKRLVYYYINSVYNIR